MITREYVVEHTEGYEGASLTWPDGVDSYRNHDPVSKTWQQYMLWWDHHDWKTTQRNLRRRRRP